MGVVIGSLNVGTAPCVECPDSPAIEVSPPVVHGTSQFESDAKYGKYRDIGAVRDVTVRRSFYCLKKNVGTVTNWLTGQSGTQSTISYNAGVDGEKTITGVFNLNGTVKYTSHSPSIFKVEAEFIGYSLDVNFVLCSGLSFENVTTKKTAIKIDNVTVEEISSVADGDGSGITFDVEDVCDWFSLPPAIAAHLPVSVPELPANFDDLILPFNYSQFENEYLRNANTIYSTAWYRNIVMKINGEVANKWTVQMPTAWNISHSRLRVGPIYRWFTLAEFTAASKTVPSIYSDLDVADATDPRLFVAYKRSENPSPDFGGFTGSKFTRVPLPTGAIRYYFAYEKMYGENGYWKASGYSRVQRDSLYTGGSWQYSYPDSAYGFSLVGFYVEYDNGVKVYYDDVNGRSVEVGGYQTDYAKLDIWWESTATNIRLVAMDTLGRKTILLDWRR